MIFALILGAIAGVVSTQFTGDFKVASIIGVAVFIFGLRKQEPDENNDAIVIYRHNPANRRRDGWF